MDPKTVVSQATVTKFSEPIKGAARLAVSSILMWLDSTIDDTQENFQSSLIRLRQIEPSLLTFTHVEECINVIKNARKQKIFLIVSGSVGKHLVPKIHDWPQLQAIYVFCFNVEFHRKWAKDMSKVKCVLNDIEPMCQQLQIDLNLGNQANISVPILGVDAVFVYAQLIMEALLQIEDDDDEISLSTLVEYCRNQNIASAEEIELFEKEYYHHSPIWWFTGLSFIYSMVNVGLRQFDVDIILKTGFFIRQLHRNIEHLFRQQQQQPSLAQANCETQFHIYYGEDLSEEHFQQLERKKGGLISFGTFLIAGYEPETYLQQFSRSATTMTGIVYVLFVMKIDLDLCWEENIPFAEITSDNKYVQDREAQILFSTHTVFRIDEIEHVVNPGIDRFYQVNLTLSSFDKHKLSIVAGSIREEIEDIKGLARVAWLLLKTDQLEQAESLYKTLLEKATTNDETAEYYYFLGLICQDKGEYKKAIKYYERNLEYKNKTLPPNHLDLTTCFNNIGLAYDSLGDYSKALFYYEQSLEIKKQALSLNHPSTAATYNNIGLAYNSMGEYSKALSSHKQSLTIRRRTLPPQHPDLATSYNNMGLVYSAVGACSKALSFFEKALKIREQALPPEHLDLASSYNNIGLIHASTENYTEALSLLQKSLEIRTKILPYNHPYLAASCNNIGLIHCSIGEYSKALLSYQQALMIQKQVLPPNHPDLAKSYWNLGALHEIMSDFPAAYDNYVCLLRIFQQRLPPNHPDFREIKSSVNRVKRKL